MIDVKQIFESVILSERPRKGHYYFSAQEVQPGWLYINKNGEFEVRPER